MVWRSHKRQADEQNWRIMVNASFFRETIHIEFRDIKDYKDAYDPIGNLMTTLS